MNLAAALEANQQQQIEVTAELNKRLTQLEMENTQLAEQVFVLLLAEQAVIRSVLQALDEVDELRLPLLPDLHQILCQRQCSLQGQLRIQACEHGSGGTARFLRPPP